MGTLREDPRSSPPKPRCRDRGEAARGLSGWDRRDVFSQVERMDCIRLSGDCGGDLSPPSLKARWRSVRYADSTRRGPKRGLRSKA